MSEAEPEAEPPGAGLASAHTGTAPEQDDALPYVAWPAAAATLIVWHACTLLVALARWVVWTTTASARPGGAGQPALSFLRPGETPAGVLQTIGQAAADVPVVQGERAVQLAGRTYKVPVHLAVVAPPHEAEASLMRSYVEAAALAGVRQVSWFDPHGVVQRAFPVATQLHLGEVQVALAPHRFPTAEGRVQVALLSSQDGKAALAQLAPTPPPPIDVQHVSEAVAQDLSPPQVLLLLSAPHDPAAPVTLAQLPDYPPWGIGLSELVPLPARMDAQTGVLAALRQLAGAGQRYGR